MSILEPLYRTSLALLTDLYQLTMAYGYWKSGVGEREAVFHMFYRSNPFGGGFAIACGVEYVVDLVSRLRFEDEDRAYLAALCGNDGQPLFEAAFLAYLKDLRFSGDIDAVAEGSVVFPHEPLVRVRGPIVQCQILETPLLNSMNFQTLIATKAARICHAACGEDVLEFGLRRAQGIDGALAASRAAFIGGCAATSNVLAGKLFGIPVRGTHAHSWVLCFESEPEAFEAYAAAMPNNCVFLVDTYDTLEGVRRAVRVGRALRDRGHELAGVRLDSGDLAYLSVEARKILDAGGFPEARIVASNDLDEHIIESLKQQGATIDVWGVGTKLATAYDQPAMGGVYKLAAIRTPGGKWQYKVKVSEQAIKVSTPGILQVRRFAQDGQFAADAVFDTRIGIEEGCTIVDPLDATRRKLLEPGAASTDLLEPVYRDGRCVYRSPPIGAVREDVQSQLARFHSGIKRFSNPHQYPVGLEPRLHELKTKLILGARGAAGGS